VRLVEDEEVSLIYQIKSPVGISRRASVLVVRDMFWYCRCGQRDAPQVSQHLKLRLVALANVMAVENDDDLLVAVSTERENHLHHALFAPAVANVPTLARILVVDSAGCKGDNGGLVAIELTVFSEPRSGHFARQSRELPETLLQIKAVLLGQLPQLKILSGPPAGRFRRLGLIGRFGIAKR
jgi:hypothetical protein